MKLSFATIGLTALLSFSAFAAPMPQEQLGRINAFIAQTLGQYGEMGKAEITKAEIDDTSKLLTSTRLELSGMADALKAGLELSLKGQEVAIKADLSASLAQLGMKPEDLLKYTEEAKKQVDELNAKGVFKATLATVTTAAASKLTVTVKPAKPGFALKVLKLTATVPSDLAKPAKIVVTGAVKADAANVAKAQAALTNVLNSLGNGQEPAESDLNALGEVFKEMMSAVDSIGSSNN